MATKAELEAEVAELQATILALGGPRPAVENCDDACPHGMAFHGGPICWGDLVANTSTACACPEHPDDPPLPVRVYS